MAEKVPGERVESTSSGASGSNAKDSRTLLGSSVSASSPLFKSVPGAKTRPLANLVLQPVYDSGSGASSPGTPPAPLSADKTDNHAPGADMCREEERLKTFDQWPLNFLTPETLARNGFYYLGRGDEVRCAFCKVEIMRWEDGDDPAKDHKRWAPQCPFLRKQAVAGNVPLDPSEGSGHDECGVRAPPSSGAGVRMPGPVHPKYASEAARLRTFKEWPRSMKQKPEELAEAGFYYTGHGDKTKCFYCDGGLKDWENDDVPWEQHARWFDRCAYVQLVKGRDYVQRVISEACLVEGEGGAPPAAAPPRTEPAEDDSSVEDSKVCRICYAEERNVAFVPCGHVVACAKCALATDKCPMCRTPFSNTVRLYFS